MILDERFRITKVICADIKVLDMSFLDTRIEGKNLVGKFISDVVLQVLSFVAESERSNIKKRQTEGIKIANEKGVRFGRPNTVLPPNVNDILNKYINHKLTNTEAASIIGVSRGTFFRLVREHRYSQVSMWASVLYPANHMEKKWMLSVFLDFFKKFLRNKMTLKSSKSKWP